MKTTLIALCLLAIALPAAAQEPLEAKPSVVEFVCDHHVDICVGAGCSSFTAEYCYWYVCVLGYSITYGWHYVTGWPGPGTQTGLIGVLTQGCPVT